MGKPIFAGSREDGRQQTAWLKPGLLLLVFLTCNSVGADDYWNYLTPGQGDVRYCSQVRCDAINYTINVTLGNLSFKDTNTSTSCRAAELAVGDGTCLNVSDVNVSPMSVGDAKEIPFVNGVGADFDYSGNLTYDAATNVVNTPYISQVLNNKLQADGTTALSSSFTMTNATDTTIQGGYFDVRSTGSTGGDPPSMVALGTLAQIQSDLYSATGFSTNVQLLGNPYSVTDVYGIYSQLNVQPTTGDIVTNAYGKSIYGVFNSNVTNAFQLHLASWTGAENLYGIYQVDANPNVLEGELTIGAYTLPNTDGSAGDILVTDGAGIVDWIGLFDTGNTWLNPVINFTDPTGGLPAAPADGDRWIALATANGWTINNVYEYVELTTSWTETVPIAGDALIVKGMSGLYFYDGAAWLTLSVTQYWQISGTNLYNLNPGNVGIGVASPVYKLDVGGTMRTTGNIDVKSDTAGLKLGNDQDILIFANSSGNFYFKPNISNTDIGINFFGTSNSGKYLWMEDEDYFKFNDDIYLTTTEKIMFGDTAISINNDGTYLTVSSNAKNFNFYDAGANGPTIRLAHATGGVGVLRLKSGVTDHLSTIAGANLDQYFFEDASSGETMEVRIYGNRTGDALRSMQIGVGVDAADTASFDGTSNYLFDGNVKINKNSKLVLNNSAEISHDGANVIFNTNMSGGGDAYFTKNVSATGYLTRTPTITGYTQNYTKELKAARYILTAEGEINKSSLFAQEKTTMKIIDKSKSLKVNITEEICKPYGEDNPVRTCWNETEEITQHPTKDEPQIQVDAMAAINRVLISEMNQKIEEQPEGITSNTLFMCEDALCKSTCKLNITKGMIISCD